MTGNQITRNADIQICAEETVRDGQWSLLVTNYLTGEAVALVTFGGDQAVVEHDPWLSGDEWLSFLDELGLETGLPIVMIPKQQKEST